MKSRNRRPQPAPSAPRRHSFVSGPRIRAGLLMSRHMEFGGVGDVEAMMTQRGLTVAPMTADGRPVERVLGPEHVTMSVIPTAGLGDLSGSLAGVVVPGDRDPLSADDAAAVNNLVATARNEGVPVLALGGGVPRALEAAGFEAPAEPPAALLIHDGVRILETPDDVRDALGVFTAAQTARRAA